MSDAARRIAENVADVKQRIGQAAASSSRSADEITLIAVTKYVDADLTASLIESGVHDLGESRPQQLWDKAEALKGHTVRWHMIGHLQRNKVRSATQWATVFHSVDSLRLAEEVSSEAGKRNQVADVLLQVNVGGEKSKHGIAVGAIEVFCEQVRALAGMRLIGLMGMMPLVDDAEEVRPLFRRLREIAEDLVTQECVPLESCELSMGMSNDFEVAVEEGATIVRVGTALFEGLPVAQTR